MPEQDILQTYIERILTAQDQQESWLTEDDLAQTARELGLSDADLVRMDKAVEAQQRRGDGFVAHEQWSDAIKEYKQAVALRPLDVDLVHKLARSYQQRWLQTGQAADRAGAERLARRCVTLDPDHAASFQLLSELKEREATALTRTPGIPRRPLFLATLAMLILLVGFTFWFLIAPTTPSDPTPPSPTPPETPIPSTEPSAFAPLPALLPDEWEVPGSAHARVGRGVESGCRILNGQKLLGVL